MSKAPSGMLSTYYSLVKIYWSPETQEKVIGGFELADAKRDASIFKAQTGMRMYKVR